jgi:hypothetical protein
MILVAPAERPRTNLGIVLPPVPLPLTALRLAVRGLSATGMEGRVVVPTLAGTIQCVVAGWDAATLQRGAVGGAYCRVRTRVGCGRLASCTTHRFGSTNGSSRVASSGASISASSSLDPARSARLVRVAVAVEWLSKRRSWKYLPSRVSGAATGPVRGRWTSSMARLPVTTARATPDGR